MSLNVYLQNAPCPHCGRSDEGYEANITHNLGEMATAAGIYAIVWRPDEHGITQAKQLIEPLRQAIANMKADAAKYKVYDCPNGWGTYEQFIPWLEQYLAACEAAPEAGVRVSR